jgi:F-type H+-transporting ATPase subunit c
MKFLKIAAAALSILFVAQAPVLAQETIAEKARIAYASSVKGAIQDARPFGIGFVIIGAGVGIGWIAQSAVQSIARQPEMANNIQTTMIIAAALIEGIAFFALIILMLFAAPWGPA